MKMKKSILCLLLALCLCLCMIFVSCKPDEEPEPAPEENKQGQVHATEDNTAGYNPDMPDRIVDDSSTGRY